MTRIGLEDSGPGVVRSVLIHEFVTGGGMADDDPPPSLAAEGGAMRRALARDFAASPGVRVFMTLDSRLPDEPGPWSTRRLGPGDEPSAIARLAAEVDFTLIVAPESEGILLDRARILDRIGARSLGCSPEAIALAGNALECLDRLRRAGLRTPPTRAVRPGDDLSIPGVPGPRRSVLKPVDGAGAMRTFVLSGDRSGWPDPSWRPGVAVLQPWIEGRHRSVSALVPAKGRPAVIGCASQRIGVDRGRVSYLGGEAPLPFGDPVRRMVDRVVAAIPGLRGWVGIDWIDDGLGDPVVLEVNPRPTTSVVGFLALLPPGMLADAWLGSTDDRGRARPGSPADRVASSLGRPVRFFPDGSLTNPRNDAGS